MENRKQKEKEIMNGQKNHESFQQLQNIVTFMSFEA